MRVVAQYHRRRSLGTRAIHLCEPGRVAREFPSLITPDPPAEWMDVPEVRARLTELWMLYRRAKAPVNNIDIAPFKRGRVVSWHLPARSADPTRQALRKALEPIGSVYVFLVPYPRVACQPITLHSMILGTPRDSVEGPEELDGVLRTVREFRGPHAADAL